MSLLSWRTLPPSGWRPPPPHVMDGWGHSTFTLTKRTCFRGEIRKSVVSKLSILFNNRFTVHKEGPNKGRKFHCCAKLQSDSTRCKFFSWADEMGSGENASPSLHGGKSKIFCSREYRNGFSCSNEMTFNLSNKSATGSKRKNAVANGKEPRKRRPPTCSKCKQEGQCENLPILAS